MKRTLIILLVAILLIGMTACNLPIENLSSIPGLGETTVQPLQEMYRLSLSLTEEGTSQGITLSSGGDVDTQSAAAGASGTVIQQTGNGQVLPAVDGNDIPDSYMQFDVDDRLLFEGAPTPSIRLDIEYYDQGTDAFTIQYDAIKGGPSGDGTFLETRPVFKTNTNLFKTVSFLLKDVYFGNRDNGADLRIDDLADGAEMIRNISITMLPVPEVINVDTCSANPLDDEPDSDAIQACLRKAQDGDTITFTSGENSTGYKGYLINKTIFLITESAKKYLTVTSTQADNPALLKANSDLKGFVLQLEARSLLSGDDEQVQFITINHLHIDGNRQERICMGPDDLDDGNGDNWGSWLPNECGAGGDSWCSPGSVNLFGNKSSNIVADSLMVTNTECATAFGMGGHDNVIMNTTIDTAGDHVHRTVCELVDVDTDPRGAWSDGITFNGYRHLILNNTIINPSDVGIVFFGGQESVIRNNIVHVTAGNHGAFAGIAIHPWGWGDIGYGQVSGNTVINEGDERCGGIHAGIDLGTHMWGGGCTNAGQYAFGNPTCSLEPAAPDGTHCQGTGTCQVWAYLPSGTTYLFTDNQVTGANINFLVEGLDLQGELTESGNISSTPRATDWQATRYGCDEIFWQPSDKIAHHPSLPGWQDIRVHCER